MKFNTYFIRTDFIDSYPSAIMSLVNILSSSPKYRMLNANLEVFMVSFHSSFLLANALCILIKWSES